MKRVLFIAWHFPPGGGPGVQRSLQFARFLPAEGYQPVVVTVSEEVHRGVAKYALDPGALRLLPDDLPVYRTGAGDPGWLRPLLFRLHLYKPARYLFYPWLWELQCNWFRPALGAARQALREQKIDLIYTSSGPWVSLRLGATLRRESGLPWIADMRDPFTQSPYQVFPSALHHAWMSRREGAWLAAADHVLANTPTSRENYCAQYPALEPARVSVLTNGFDGEEYAASPPAREEKRICRLVYTGILVDAEENDFATLSSARKRTGWWGEYWPEGYLRQTRSAYKLFDAIALCAAREPAFRESFRFTLCGELGPTARAHAIALGIFDLLELRGSVSHAEAVARQRAADILFLPLEIRCDRGRPCFIPGKLFEYLGTRKPILILSDPSDALDIAREAGLACEADPLDTESIARQLLELWQRWRRGAPLVAPKEEAILRYERRRLTKALAKVFERVVMEER